MATIALYSNKINQMPGMIKDIRQSVVDYKTELNILKIKTLGINSSACDFDDVISSIQTSTQTQEDKLTSLDTFIQNSEDFITDVVCIDETAADIIRQNKDDFYEEYYYLKPECEKNGWEEFKDDCKKVGEWCKEHWQEILITVVIVIGAVLAIAAVICSGGLALAPILAAGLTSLGISAGTAMTIATVTSLVISVVAVGSTLASSTLNIIDTWCDMSNNSTFKSWQNAMNWISVISNGFYSIGAIYNSLHGISNASLREFGKMLNGKNSYISQISTSPNTSAFWSGLGKNGDEIAANAARSAGKETLEMTLKKNGIDMPKWDAQIQTSIEAWRNASSAFAYNSSGKVVVFLGENVFKHSIWRTLEYPLLQINPSITGIVNSSGSLIRYFSISSLLGSIGNSVEAIINGLSIRSEIIED